MRFIANLGLALGTLVLGGCGGGGGGGSTPAPTPSVVISSSNQSAVARATVNGGQALGQTGALDSNGRVSAQSVGTASAGLRLGAVQTALQRAVLAGFAPQRNAAIASATRPLAISTTSQPCAAGGSIAVAVNDVDNNHVGSRGDLLTITFNQCKDAATESVNGAMVFTIDSIASSGSSTDVQFSGTVAFQQVSVVDGANSATISGSVSVALLLTANAASMTLTVNNDALALTATGPGYSDSIAYDPGMQIVVDASSTASSVRLNGSFQASSIGGRISVSTLAPITQASTDAYPNGGQVRVTGAAGSQLLVTAVNNAQVRLELDANGDGAYEATLLKPWGTLGS